MRRLPVTVLRGAGRPRTLCRGCDRTSAPMEAELLSLAAVPHAPRCPVAFALRLDRPWAPRPRGAAA